jgi:hypothetical protein
MTGLPLSMSCMAVPMATAMLRRSPLSLKPNARGSGSTWLPSHRVPELRRARAGGRSSRTSRGSLHGRFRSVNDRGDLAVAEASASELGSLSPADAIDYRGLVSRKDPDRYHLTVERVLVSELQAFERRRTFCMIQDGRQARCSSPPADSPRVPT